MAFIALTTAETDFKSPMDEDLWKKVKDNFDDLNSRLTAVEGVSKEPDNTVVTSAVDSSGRPNYVSAGAGLSVNVDGSVTNVVMHIDGKVQTITTNTNLASLTDNETIFVYAEQAAGTVPTLGFQALTGSVKAPFYGYAAPGSPVTGDYWFDLGANKMKRYDGAAFVAVKRIFIALAITSGGAVTQVVTFANRITPHQRFDWFGDGSDGTLEVTAGTTTVDGLRQYTLLRVLSGATLNNTTQSDRQIRLVCQGPVVIAGTVDLRGRGAQGGNSGLTPADGGFGGTGGGGGGGGTPTAGGAHLVEMSGRHKDAAGAGGTAGTASAFEAQFDGLMAYFLAGSGGGGETANVGGGNGGAGVLILAPEIVVSGTVDSRGNDGASNGAGGGGGCVVTAARSFTKSGSILVAGGTGAGAGPTGGNGGAGTETNLQV